MKFFFYDNFSANFVISVVKFVDAGCRYHGKRGTVSNCPFIRLLFFLRSSRGQGNFSQEENKEVS